MYGLTRGLRVEAVMTVTAVILQKTARFDRKGEPR